MTLCPPPASGPAGRRCVLALDVGGTAMKGAVVATDGSVLHRIRRPTPAAGDDAGIVAAVAAVFSGLRAGVPAGSAVAAAGLVVPGIVDERRGIAVHSTNLAWRDLPLRSLVGAATGLPLGFGHDVRAGGLAESLLGAARGARRAVFVPVGTGVAAALVLDGRVVDGGGYAGEIGHVDTGYDEQCACGRRGCLEAVASAAAIPRRYTAASGRPAADARTVLERADEGDPDADRVWSTAVDALLTALAWLTVIVAPEVIVIGGGLAGAGERLLGRLRSDLPARLGAVPMPRVLPAALGQDAGCLGAGVLAWRAAGEARWPDREVSGGPA